MLQRFLFLLAVLVAVVLVVQVVIPLWNDRAIFPMFREKRKLEKKLGVLKEDAETDKLRRRVDKAEGKPSVADPK